MSINIKTTTKLSARDIIFDICSIMFGVYYYNQNTYLRRVLHLYGGVLGSTALVRIPDFYGVLAHCKRVIRVIE